MRPAEWVWMLGCHICQRTAAVFPDPNTKVALLARPEVLPVVDVRPIRANRFQAVP